jgi:hypothetical protein
MERLIVSSLGFGEGGNGLQSQRWLGKTKKEEVPKDFLYVSLLFAEILSWFLCSVKSILERGF